MKKQKQRPTKEAKSRLKKYALARESSGEKKQREKPENTQRTAVQLLKFLQPQLLPILLVLLVSVCAALMNAILPSLLGDTVNAINAQFQAKIDMKSMNMDAIRDSILWLSGIAIGGTLFQFLQRYVMAGITQRFVRSLRDRVNEKLSRMPLKYFDSHSKGDILSKMMNDIDNISVTVQNNIIQIVTSLVSFVAMLVMMIRTSPTLTWVTGAAMVPSLLAIALIARKSRRYFRKQWDYMGELNGHIEEMYTGHKLVKLFDYEKKAAAEFDDINDELMNVSRRAEFISGLIGPIIGFVGNLSYVFICAIGGSLVLRGEMDLGDITTFFLYSRLFIEPLVNLGNMANTLQSSLASAERVFVLLEEEEEPAEQVLYTIEKPTGAVSFEHVDFSYNKEKSLIRDLNLDVAPGQLIAIVGPTGAGKTTIVNLLMRFYDVNAGAIKVDGIDIREIARSNLRSIFGMVLQDTWLFEGTVRENIAYGKRDATQEEILAAAKAARVKHYIDIMPEGMDTILEEEGANLSQGQRQLLTIARALLADPAILILDEATSSVDTRTEVLIQQATQTLMQGRTSFVIAHRLSTIRNADMILVMQDGSIVETGTHQALMDRDGFYTKLYNSQFAQEQRDAEVS